MKRRVLLLTALTAGLVGIGNAHARAEQADGHKLFDTLDADGNGQLSQAELRDMPAALGRLRFDKADANGDGAIDKDEFMAQSRKRAERLFAHMDANDDGKIDADEAKPPQRGADRHGPKGEHKSGDFFARMDADHNGSISRDEFEQAARKHRSEHSRP